MAKSPRIRFSSHAHVRMAHRGITVRIVTQTILNPDSVSDSDSGEGRKKAAKCFGNYTYVVIYKALDDDTVLVVTTYVSER